MTHIVQFFFINQLRQKEKNEEHRLLKLFIPIAKKASVGIIHYPVVVSDYVFKLKALSKRFSGFPVNQ